MEDLRQQLSVSKLKNMTLLRENQALKVLVRNEESKWMHGMVLMQAGNVSLESQLENANVVQRGLESELREMKKRLIVKDKDRQFLNNPEEAQAVSQRLTEELREYKQKVEDVEREKDEVIATFQSEKAALVDMNEELMAKLKTTQTQILQSETDCNLRVNALENQLEIEKMEKDVCVIKIRELEGLVETTEKTWLNLQEDLQKNVEVILTAMHTHLESDWVLKVKTLEDQLRRKQMEQETCLPIIEELKSQVEATEKKLLDLQGESQQTEEDLKFLIVKSIKLQVSDISSVWFEQQLVGFVSLFPI